jgi:hypothetical protein
MECLVGKPEIGGGLVRNSCHKAMFGFFDHTGFISIIRKIEVHDPMASSLRDAP